MTRAACVYVVTNRLNGKKYVGQTWLSVERRWLAHCNDARSGRGFCRVFHAAIRKYGPENFSVETFPLLACSTQDELDIAEQRMIAELKSLGPKGYNLLAARGGRGVHHEETKKLMSAAHMGRPHTSEHSANISAALVGRKYSAERIAKMRAGRWSRPYQHSDETRAKISAAFGGKPWSAKRREAYNKRFPAHNRIQATTHKTQFV